MRHEFVICISTFISTSAQLLRMKFLQEIKKFVSTPIILNQIFSRKKIQMNPTKNNKNAND